MKVKIKGLTRLVFNWDTKKPAGFPALGIRRSMVMACRYIDGLSMCHVRGGLFVCGTEEQYGMSVIPVHGKWRLREDWVKFGTGEKAIRRNSEYQDWSMEFEIEYMPNIVTKKQVLEILRTAGTMPSPWR